MRTLVMRRSGISTAVAVGLMIVGVLIGVTGYYVATTYQTKLVTVTTTQTTTFSTTYTEVQVQTSYVSTTMSQTVTSTVVSISTTSIYPVPDNATLVFADSSGSYTYSIQVGSSTTSGSASGTDTFNLTPLFKGEGITVELATGSALPENGFSCGIGNTATMQLYLNGQLVAHASKECSGSGYAVITYTI
jgi:hypothetical protein